MAIGRAAGNDMEEKFFTYILQSESTGRYYVGHTGNLDERLLSHNGGKVKSTRKKGPWKVKYVEEYESKLEANRRELEIKSKKSKKFIEYLIDYKRE